MSSGRKPGSYPSSYTLTITAGIFNQRWCSQMRTRGCHLNLQDNPRPGSLPTGPQQCAVASTSEYECTWSQCIEPAWPLGWTGEETDYTRPGTLIFWPSLCNPLPAYLWEKDPPGGEWRRSWRSSTPEATVTREDTGPQRPMQVSPKPQH